MSEPSDTTVTISLTVKDVAGALDFYAKAFGAQESLRMPMPDGTVVHAEFSIGATPMYISCESEDWDAFPNQPNQSASCLFSVGTDDCDAAFQRALEAGATPIEEPKDQFWGCRTGVVRDPYGYRWSLRQVVEILSEDEIMDRVKQMVS